MPWSGISGFSPDLGKSHEGRNWQTRAQDAYGQMQPASEQMWGDLQDMMWRRQRGEAPSAANLAMQAGLDQAAQAGAANAQGASPLLAARQGALAGSGAGMQAVGQGAQARSQEQAANMGQMLANQQHKDRLTANYMAAGMSAAEAQRQAELALAGQQLAAEQLRNKKRKSNIRLGKKVAGTGMKMIGAAFGLSDKNAKENITKTSDRDYEEFLDALTGYDWNYKKSYKNDKDRYSGVMAQDLEKSKLGRKTVIRKSLGKHKNVRHINLDALHQTLKGAADYLKNKVGK